MPSHVFTQLEGDSLAVLRGRPARCQNWHIAFIGTIDEWLHNAPSNLVYAGRGAQCRIEDTLLGIHMDDDRAAALYFFRVAWRRRDRKSGEKQAKASFFDMHSLFP